MRLSTELKNLEQQRQRELAKLGARFSKVADTIEHDVSPVQWVRKNPYIATASAAAAGFVVAQLAGRSKSRAPSPPAAPAPAVAPPAEAAVQGSIFAGLLPILLNVAQRVLQPQPEAEATAVGVTIANAGSVTDHSFPQSYSWAAEPAPGAQADGSASPA